MKKTLVTGADGFIGSHLCEYLVQKGYSVKALCQYNSFSSYGWLNNSIYAQDMEIILGDIRDPQQMKLISKNCASILHLAALIGIPYSYIAPNSYVETNINGTINMLNAAKENNVQRFIQTSTSEVYGSAQYIPIDEKHPLQAQSPYSASKIGSDSIAYSYWSSFEMPISIARPFNTYGPRQSARAIIPSIIIQALSGKKSLKLGNLEPTRDLNYVLDTCKGFHELLEADECSWGQVYNIGSGEEISMRELAYKIIALCQSDAAIESDVQRYRPENSEVSRLLANPKKLNSLSGYTPQYNLTQGLTEMINWFRIDENMNLYKRDIYNV